MTSAVNNNTVSQNVLDAMNPQSASSKSAAEAQQDQFLTLLVTQMQNQDPLNPMDNAEVTSQFAQLSTVTGIDKLNTTLQSMMGSSQTGQSLQAANLIGHGVLAPGSTMTLADSKAIMGVEFPENVDGATVVIKDANGNQVATLDLGAQKAGTLPLLWDGTKTDGTKAADGDYSFQVKATVASSAADATALQFGMVTSITTTAGQDAKVNASGLGAIDYNDIRQIL
ncbi:MAG TPA: flagellar hook assembly protein FlgD [Oxalicibacterium sp.]|jgi:flagellar basal-body rod modification protein FlgD|nr:flagellar hook assembly protein FlgD [Oxalicibacterium sp.]